MVQLAYRYCAEITASSVSFRNEISNVFNPAPQGLQAKETDREADMSLQRTGGEGELIAMHFSNI